MNRLEFLSSGLVGGNATDFCTVGVNLLDSEEVTSRVYEIFIACMADLYVSSVGATELSHMDVGYHLKFGMYIPCTNRVVITGGVDTLNDTIPKRLSVVDKREDGIEICNVSLVNKFPRGWASFVKGQKLKATFLVGHDERNRRDRLSVGVDKKAVQALDVYFTVDPNGNVVHAKRVGRNDIPASVYAGMIFRAATAVSIHADRKHLWQVKARERIYSNWEKTELTLGCDAEQVKSLFYARANPLTDTGRKRPILHWVRSHERRLRDGVDIDIQKHLRGVTAFEMDGVEYEITEPVKKSQKLAA